MKVYKTEFKKKNNELRQITFVRPSVDQADDAFISTNIKGVRKVTLSEEFERVWDVEANGFRTINHKELTQPIEHIGNSVYVEITNTFVF
jgi:hypothetical protein